MMAAEAPVRTCEQCGAPLVLDHWVWPNVAPTSRVQYAWGCLACDEMVDPRNKHE